ncbi:S-adenosyl-L-methionine-dependent methyltransferase [Mycena maculata]|uniref:S-adenosyl-L-methionine-dependent methyltransferase n=1 Tax=Mycena maculata TaxID=230809 RepID=A0AAD7NJC8_9AGAR|nr:S-adenosyl-L-methionine-dependent methyltransferase [Mycena maculata]
MAPIAPSASLPPLRRLDQDGYSVADISRTLRGIQQLYWPPPSLPPKLSVPVRNIMRARRPKMSHIYTDDKVPDSGYASAVASDDECDPESVDDGDSDSSDTVDELRADPFERAFAIKWITGLIGRVDALSSDDPTVDPEDARELLLEEATALLALFSHQEDEEEYDIIRSFSFPSQGNIVHIELNDAPLSNSDHTSVGLQSWGSAIILAERLCVDPASFDLVDGRPLRILELGAGTGLLSIAVAKLLPSTTVVATDYHPAILANLAANLQTNFPSLSDQARVSTHELDWAQPVLRAPLDAPFDVILAADVVYHPEHARWIRGCVARMLRRPGPDSASGGTFHLIVPLRTSGRNEGMDRTVDEVFGTDGGAPSADGTQDTADGVHRLAILDTTAVERQGAGVGRADEAGYRVFRIGWVSY